MRTYNETHPWIKFQLDVSKVDYRLWLLLGEAQSKCFHIAGVPLLPEVAEELYTIYLTKGVLATNAIEGNTLTEVEVRQRIDGKQSLPPSKEYLGQEVDNIVEACNEIIFQITSGHPVELSVELIKSYNAKVLHNLPSDEEVVPGKIRSYDVYVGRYKGAPSEDCDYLLSRLCDWLNQDFTVMEQYKVAFGILKAIIAHLYIAWIHPFGDGNGRTARLLELQILLGVGVPSASAHLLSNHYNQTRSEYYRQLERASKSNGDVVPFIMYALQGFVDGLKQQIEVVQEQQLRVHLVNYIHDMFKNQDAKIDIRRRRLALDLATLDSPIKFDEIRYITPRIAEAYANLSDKTIERDIKELEQINLIVSTKEGIRINRELMLAFLPPTRTV